MLFFNLFRDNWEAIQLFPIFASGIPAQTLRCAFPLYLTPTDNNPLYPAVTLSCTCHPTQRPAVFQPDMLSNSKPTYVAEQLRKKNSYSLNSQWVQVLAGLEGCGYTSALTFWLYTLCRPRLGEVWGTGSRLIVLTGEKQCHPTNFKSPVPHQTIPREEFQHCLGSIRCSRYHTVQGQWGRKCSKVVEKPHSFKSTQYNLLSIKTLYDMIPDYLPDLFSFSASFL